MEYHRCGKSGLLLPRISLGMWHNFGTESPYSLSSELINTAIDLGVAHFDTANVYGPPSGSSEERLGQILKNDHAGRRDELVIATKAGVKKGNSPYGQGRSRKHIISAAEQSLKRLGLDYVDIFYSHRPDPETPTEEAAAALSHLVKTGKALYIGITRYDSEQTRSIAEALRAEGTPMLINQVQHSMLSPFNSKKLMPVIEELGAGAIVYAPLAGGRLSEKYLNGIPANSRAGRNSSLSEKSITEKLIKLVTQLNEIAAARGQTLPQMALTWAIKDSPTCSALMGASSADQIKQNCMVVEQAELDTEELSKISQLLESYHGKPL